MKFGLGLIISSLFKLIFKILYFIFLIVAHLLLYFGLWIPTLYLTITGIIMLTGGIDLTQYNINTVLFYLGLGLTLLGSLVITIRNLIVKPLNEVIKEREVKREFKRREALEKERRMYERNPAKYYAKVEGAAPHASHPVYSQSREERGEYTPPLVYYSNVDPSLLIHEYRDYFEIFREENGKIYHLDTRQKPNSLKADKALTKEKRKNKKKKGDRQNGH